MVINKNQKRTNEEDQVYGQRIAIKSNLIPEFTIGTLTRTNISVIFPLL
jgi:hypothetical protein